LYSQRKIVLMLAALLALAALVAGCGGGGSSSSSSSSTDSAAEAESESSSSGESESSDESGADSESDGEDESGSDDSGAAPTKAAFIKEADKICGDADAVMAEEITDYAKENDIPIEKEEPSEDQQVKIFHAVVLPNIHKQAEDIAALTPPAGDEETVEDITDTLLSEVEDAEGEDGIPDESTLEEASQKAQDYGLKTCGS
jgi:hypothetical protein